MTDMLNPSKSAWQAPGQLFARLGALKRRVKIEGFVDNIAANEVMGWAWDPQGPNRRVHIVARAEGKVVAEALADLPRGDLASAGKGDGRHGFRLRLPNGLAGLDVTIEAVARPRNQPLQRGQLRVPEPVAVPKPEKARPNNRVGVLERLRNGQLSGWAVDPKHPESPAQLDIFDGERYIGSATCDSIRPDVAEAGGPPGARSFVFTIPGDSGLAGSENIRARIVGSRHDLRRSKSFGEADGGLPAAGEARAPLQDTAEATPARPDGHPTSALHYPSRIEGLAVVVCGPDPADQFQQTLASITAVCGPEARATVLSGLPATEAAAALNQTLDACSEVVVLLPGQVLNGLDLQSLLALRPFADVWLFGARADRAALFSWQTGADIRCLVVRASALRAWPDAAGALGRGDLAALATWSCRQGHRWDSLPHDPVDGPSLRPQTAGQPLGSAPRRVTLGLWGDWAGTIPAGLVTLLKGCADLDVEILCPDETTGKAVQALETGSLANLDTRVVPVRGRPGSGSHLRALAGAATGQVVVLAHAGLAYARPETLPEVLAWALAEGVGCVTVPIQTDGSVLSGLALDSSGGAVSVQSGAVPQAPRDCAPILAAPAEFLVMSRNLLAVMEGLDAGRFPDRHADLDLGIRLLGRQRHGLSVDRLGATLKGEADLQVRTGAVSASEAFLLGIRPPCETGATTLLERR